jgi:type II secretory pathway component PulJ
MTLVLLIFLAAVLLFAFGVLYGNSRETHAASQRSRRQAAIQREINDQVRALEAAGLLNALQAARYTSYEIGHR